MAGHGLVPPPHLVAGTPLRIGPPAHVTNRTNAQVTRAGQVASFQFVCLLISSGVREAQGHPDLHPSGVVLNSRPCGSLHLGMLSLILCYHYLLLLLWLLSVCAGAMLGCHPSSNPDGLADMEDERGDISVDGGGSHRGGSRGEVGACSSPAILAERSYRPPRCSGQSLPGWSSASDDGQGNMSSGPLYLLGCDVNWPVLEDAVGKQAGVDATVVPIGLLGDGVTGAADESPFTSVMGLVDTEVFVLNEPGDIHQVSPTVLACVVILRDVRIVVGDGPVGGVDNDADPVVVIPVDGNDELVV